MTSKTPIPASIANASREELQKLLVETLKKLKVRDKKIEDLNNLLTLEKADDEKAAARVSSLEATVQALEAKLLSAEESYKKRLDAETELLNSQLHDLQSKLSSEHVMSTELQEQLGRREYQLGVLQEKESALETQVLSLTQQLREASAAATAENARVEDLQHKLIALEKDAESRKNAANTAAHEDLQQQVARLTHDCTILRSDAEDNQQQWSKLQSDQHRQLEESLSAIAAAKQRAEAAESEAKRLAVELDKGHAIAEKLQSEMERIQLKLQGSEQRRINLEEELKQLSHEHVVALESAETKSVSVHKKLEEKLTQLQQAVVSNAKLFEQLKDVQSQLAEQTRSLSESSQRITELEAQLADRAHQLQETKIQAEADVSRLTLAQGELQQRIEELHKKRVTAEQRADAAEGKVQALTEQLTAMSASAAPTTAAMELAAREKGADSSFEQPNLVGNKHLQQSFEQHPQGLQAGSMQIDSLHISELERMLEDAKSDAKTMHDRAALLEQQLLQASEEQEALQDRIASLEKLHVAEEQAIYVDSAAAEADAQQADSVKRNLALAEEQAALFQAEAQQLKQQLDIAAQEEALEERLLGKIQALELQVEDLSEQKGFLLEKLQNAESLVVDRENALKDLTNRLEDQRTSNNVESGELRALLKQMQMELDVAENEVIKAQAAYAALKAQNQEEKCVQSIPDNDGNTASSTDAAMPEQLSQLRSKVERLEQENERLLEAEQQTAAELAQRLVEIANRGQAVAEQRVNQELLQGAIQTVRAHVSELEETLHHREEEMAALEEELASLKQASPSPGSKDACQANSKGMEVETLREKVASLEAELQAAAQQLEDAKSSRESKQELERVKAELFQAQAKLEKVEDLQQRLTTAEEQVAWSNAAIAEAQEMFRSQVASLEGQLAAAALETSSEVSRARALEQELQLLRAAETPPGADCIARLQSQLDEAYAASADAKKRIAELEHMLQLQNSSDRQHHMEHDNAVKAQQQQVKELEGALASARAELASKEEIIRQLEQRGMASVPVKDRAADDAETDADMASAGVEAFVIAADASPPAAPVPIDDSAQLKVEHSRLQKELHEAKRKFVLVAKKKQQEFASKLQELENQLAATEAARRDLEVQLAQARSERADALSLVESSQVADLTQRLQASQAEVESMRKDQEAERSRVKRAVAEMKKKIESLQKERQSAEVEAAEARGKASAELARLKSELSGSENRVHQAKEDISRLETELKDYKARAHALLRAKAAEIQSAKDAARDELKGALEGAELRAAHAEEQLRQLSNELKAVRASMAVELAAASSRHEAEAGQLRLSEVQALEATEAAKRAYDQLKVRYESLEARLHAVQQQLVEVQQQAGGAEELRKQLEEVRGEQTALREHTRAASEAKDAEISRLLECNATLRDELTALRARTEQLQRSTTLDSGLGAAAGGSGFHHAERSLSVSTSVSRMGDYGRGGAASDGLDMESMLESGSGHFVALAERDKMLHAAHRRAAELEHEVAELERECQLRQVQETALKEAVRDLQREIERLRLPGKTSDIEYLKNVLLKMYETGEAESLLPVVATILRLSPAEVEHCKEGIKKNKLERHSSTAPPSEPAGDVGSYISGWASWLGSGS